MSSDYRMFCVSHEPAILTGLEYNEPEPAMRAAVEENEHPNCRLLIGRWSGALVELGCPSSAVRATHGGVWHRDIVWVDASWLRLLALADPEQVPRARLWGCWTQDIAKRLWQHLDIREVAGD